MIISNRLTNLMQQTHARVQPSRPADVIAKDANKVYLYGIIAPDWGVSAASLIAALAPMKGAVTLHINSDGGDVFEAVSMTAELARYRRDKGKVSVVIDGMAASAAGFVAMAGNDKPDILETAQLMIHKPMTFAGGNADELLRVVARLDQTERDSMLPYYRRSGKTDEALAAIMRAETFYSAQQAVDEGFARAVIPAVAPAAVDKRRAQLLAAIYPNFPAAAFGCRNDLRPAGVAAKARTLTLPTVPDSKFRAE